MNSLLKSAAPKPAAAFSSPRDFLENRFVYLTISPRARGLSIGLNVNPDRQCNFDCAYCEVNRTQKAGEAELDCEVAAAELERALALVSSGDLKALPPYGAYPQELLRLKHVALSGDGEPTISPRFLEAVETVVHVRARGAFPFFKMVLITNASGLDRPEVQLGLSYFTPKDEVWAKLDAGSAAMFERVNRPTVPFDKVLGNILLVAKRRPVVIQSLFCEMEGRGPSAADIMEYALRLKELKERGAHIQMVQVYSANRPTTHVEVRHLPLKTLREIAAQVRKITGLNAETF